MNYFDDDKTNLPPLIPIKVLRKKQNLAQDGSNGESHAALSEAESEERPQPQEKEEKKEKERRPSAIPERVEEISRQYTLQQEEGRKKDVHDLGKKDEDSVRMQQRKSKQMVAQMMRKINAKNISEELHPITNETILEEVRRLNAEMEELKIEAQRKEHSLLTNPNNQHLRGQHKALTAAIDRCVRIKQLYYQKINLRNKVEILEQTIIGLREENNNLLIRRQRQEESSGMHAMGAPCQKERQMRDELARCKEELKKEKKMREQLEGNINSIVQNFNRLYEEADTARKVVTRKLAELAEREKSIKEPVRAHKQGDSSSNNITPEISPNSPELKPLKPISNRENVSPILEGQKGGQSSSSGTRPRNAGNTVRKGAGNGGLQEQLRMMRKIPTARNRYCQ